LFQVASQMPFSDGEGEDEGEDEEEEEAGEE
jgi:hypothetical protein